MNAYYDLCLQPEWVLPMEQAGIVLENTDVLIADGQIKALSPRADSPLDRCKTIIPLEKQVLMPGFINTHTHMGMNLLRGLADDKPLMTWLQDYIWPTETKWVSDAFVTDGARLAIAEQIKGGITCFNDQYFFPNAVADVADQSGMRGLVGFPLLSVPTAWAADTETYFSKALKIQEAWSNHPRIETVWSPHAPYTVDDESFIRIRDLNEKTPAQFHIHLHESAGEIEDSLKQFGMRPFDRLEKLGLVQENMLAVHMTQMTEHEIERCAKKGVSIAHCPESNMKLASGIAPVTQLTEAGVTVGLGTDGAASNNDLDLLGEARTASFLAKVSSMNPEALPAWKILSMLTLEGAQSVMKDHEIGSITPGKQADLISIDLSQLETQPLYDIASHLVYCASRHHVQNTWVAGQALMRDRKLCTLNEAELLDTAELWRQRILETVS